jgi:hypothetical protein
MTTFRVRYKELGPGRREEYALVIAVDLAHATYDRLTRQVFEGRGGIDQSPVEEYPAVEAIRFQSISECHCDRPAGERRSVHPGQRDTIALTLFPNDPATGFFNN